MGKETKGKQGFVYIMSNPAYKKNLLKVGFTRKTPEERAKELYKTGVPNEFKVEYKVKFKDAEKAERQIHSSLEKCRHNKKREFFACNLVKIKNAINNADGKIQTPDNQDNSLVIILTAIIIFLSVLLIFSS